METLERRYTVRPTRGTTPRGRLSFRATRGDDDKLGELWGYAAVFYNRNIPGTEYDLTGDGSAIERIDPHAFDRALREGHDVRGLFNHQSENLLARVSSGTLSLSTDSVGLLYRMQLPNTQMGRDVRELVRRGDLSGSSFAFIPTGARWEILDDGTEVRWIEDVNLIDVGPVTFPAYEGTTAGLRFDQRLSRFELRSLRSRDRGLAQAYFPNKFLSRRQSR